MIKGKLCSLLYLVRTVRDPVVEQLALHSLLFIIFSCFVRAKTYNSIERTLLKFFLENAQDMIRDIMMLNKCVKIFFYLTIFESEFADPIP